MSKFSKLVQKQKGAKQSKKNNFNLEAITNANRKRVICCCGSNQSYKSCCATIHADITLAKNPLELMKSRYTAYVRGDINYLMLSHHSSTRPINDVDEILKWAKKVNWKGLEIIEFDVAKNDVGFVTFKAFFIENGKHNTIYEKSRFVKENNHWSYIDGIHL